MWQSLWQWFVEPVHQWLLMGCGAAFGLGFILGRGLRLGRGRDGAVVAGRDEAFFKGIRYILSNDHDHAIEELTKSVQVNSDTIETYMALGNLYRSKGDIDRAIRIRQSIILRPRLDGQLKARALFDLGLDYRKGGFLNRALKTFQEVIRRNPSDVEALKMIERIYEELRDWGNAYRTRQRIARCVRGDHRNVLAHHLVENGKVHQEKGDLGRAVSLYNKAISTHKACVDAYLHLGDLYFGRLEYKKAIATWKRAVKAAPQFTFLAYRRLEGAYAAMDNLKPVEDFLKECAGDDADAFTHVALARYLYNDDDVDGALEEIESALRLDPSFWKARKLKGEILLGQGRDRAALNEYRALIRQLDVPYLKFRCSECGYQPGDLQWQCPQCREWDTIHLVDSEGAIRKAP